MIGFKTAETDSTTSVDPILLGSLRKLNKKEAVTKQKVVKLSCTLCTSSIVFVEILSVCWYYCY